MSAELDELRNLWNATAEPDEQTRAAAQARLLAEIAAEPTTLLGSRTAPGGSRSRRRLLLAVAAVVFIVAASSVGIAAALGAFSGNTTTFDLRACNASTIALTTPSGAQVLTGHTDAGVYCVAYRNSDGVEAGSSDTLGNTPVGQAVAVGTMDTASHTSVIAGVVPPGYDELSIGGQQIPIKNQAFVVDAKSAGPGTLSGPAGTAAVNLQMFAAP
jgi:hypothetical protein